MEVTKLKGNGKIVTARTEIYVPHLDEVFEPGLIKIAYTGAGCMFIHRSVLEKIKFRYDDEIDAWDDRWFGFDAYKNGFEIYLDNTVKCRHLYVKRPFKWEDIKKNRENF